MSGAVQQSGPVNAGRVVTWAKNGIVVDGGPAGNGVLSEIGITNDGSLALGINSGTISEPFVQLGFSTNSDGTIVVSALSFNGAPPVDLVFDINGVLYPFNPSGNGNITGPGSVVSGDLVAFNGSGGNLVKDSGLSPEFIVQGPTTAVVAGHLAIFTNSSGTQIEDGGPLITDFVVGPTEAVSGNLAAFDGTTGDLIEDIGIPSDTIVQGPTDAVSGNLAGFNGTTGKVVKDSGFSISLAMGTVVAASSVEIAREILVGSLVAKATHAPTSLGNYAAITTAYTGDLSQVGWPFPYTITGVSTLGEPATGYMYTPECSMYYDYLLNQSGWNNDTGDNNGRTAATCHFTVVDNDGQGDCMGYVVIGFVDSVKPGATNWLASPAITAYAADMRARIAGCYLNPVEIDCTDEGFDCAGITFVGNLNRTVSTAALGEAWIGLRLDSTGSAAVDAAISASGTFTIGMDFTTANFGVQQAAITMKDNQRIYFGATNTSGFPLGTDPTGPYITSDGSILVINGGTAGGAIEISLSGTVVTVQGELLTTGPCEPVNDNAYTLGGSSNRWSEVFAANGTINTSDENEKQDISDVPAALMDAWDALSPRIFKRRDAVEKKGAGAARTHTGYIAQEFAAALLQQKVAPAEWGGWCNDVLKSGGERQGLRYDELFTIADAAHRRRMNAVEGRLAALEAAIRTQKP